MPPFSGSTSLRFSKVVPVIMLGFFLVNLAALGQVATSPQAASAQGFEEAFLQDFNLPLAQRAKDLFVPGLSLAVIQDAKLVWAKGYGRLSAKQAEPITPDTVFSVGSISKVATAVMTLRLVAQGKLDLDTDINTYMTGWQVPDSPFTAKNPVTLRHIMSHTAGFTVHGFRDFQPGETLPSTVEILLGRHPAKNSAVLVDFEPGSRFRYSGGGTTVQQLIAEEMTRNAFPTAAADLVFKPLGMSRSSFVNPLPAGHGNIAKAHNRMGQPTALPRGWEAMPEMAASGLWTTPSDLARLMIALIETHRGTRSDFLPPALVKDMMTPVAPAKVGLGPFIYGSSIFGHGGANNSYKAQIVADLKTGNGIVILANSATGKRVIKDIITTMKRLEGWDWE